MIAANRLTGVKAGSGFYTLETDGPVVRLHFLTDDIVRVRASFDRAFAEESYTLVLTAWEDRLDALLAGERRRSIP